MFEFRQIGDLNVSYEVAGEGNPLLLLHGGGSRASCYEDMVPILSKQFKTYSYDQRGFGDTVKPENPPMGHELWREDVRSFMDSFNLDKTALVGWSMGAGIALNFVLTYPERVSHLILIGAGSPRLPASDRSGFESRRKLIESGATAEEIVEKTFDFTKAAFSQYSQDHNAYAVEKIREEHLRNDPKAYLQLLEANADRPKLGPRLGEISCPTLLIVGDSDGRTPLPNTIDLNMAIPGSFMKVVQDCGHFYGYEQPEATCSAMIDFLKAFS